MKNRIPKPVQRLIEVAGQDFTAYSCRVTNPNITARESIVIGDYIVKLQAELAKVTAERDKLKKCLFNVTMYNPSCDEYKEGYKMLNVLLPNRFEDF